MFDWVVSDIEQVGRPLEDLGESWKTGGRLVRVREGG